MYLGEPTRGTAPRVSIRGSRIYARLRSKHRLLGPTRVVGKLPGAGSTGRDAMLFDRHV